MGEVIVQSHNVGLTSYRLTSLSFHVKRASHSWVTTFLKIWPWKSRVKVMGVVTVQSHNVGLTSYRFTSLSFHVNRPSHSWDTVFSKFDLEKQGSRSNGHDVAQQLDNSIELRMVQIHPGVSEIWVPQSLAQVLPDLTSFWPISKRIWGKWANNYDSAQLQVQTSPWNFKWGQSIQQFQRYAFRKVWTKFVPNLTGFWPMGKPIWGKWANDHDSAQLQA